METNPIDVAYVKSILAYRPKTGQLIWVDPAGTKTRPGAIAGYALARGNIIVMIDGRNYQAHRLAWAIYYGVDPDHIIDHIDGDPGNNRIDNLRRANQSQNGGNSRKSRKGLKGAYPNSSGCTWCAKIRVGPQKMYLGCFKTEQEAHEAYCAAARKYFGEFARFE